MENKNLKTVVPRVPKEDLEISLFPGEQCFLVGKNGSGKSALLQRIASSNRDQNIVRVLAHRQTWLRSSFIDVTAENRKSHEESILIQDRHINSLWQDRYANERISSTLFDLVSKDNDRARSIRNILSDKGPQMAFDELSKYASVFDELNTLLATGNLKVSLQISEGEDIQAKHLDNDTTFSMAQMSDGERNAALIAATIITAPQYSFFLIDEPERHLHRSIIEPFLTSLFNHRDDCAFVVSTHELSLPISNQNSEILLVRSCNWSNNEVESWDAEIILPNSDLPEDLKIDILGSRKRILFVEGDREGSLDLPLYDILFPDVSVIPKGNCVDVMRAVTGLRDSTSLHHADAFGLVDGDGMSSSKISQLSQNQVVALGVYSVEGLYYCSDAVRAVAQKQADTLGVEANVLVAAAQEKALQSLESESVAEKMVSVRCMQHLRNQAQSKVPKWEDVKTNTKKTIEISIPSPMSREKSHFDTLLSNKDLNALVARYPIKKSPIPDKIADALHLQNRHDYEQALLTQARANLDLAEKLRNRMKPLAEKLTES